MSTKPLDTQVFRMPRGAAVPSAGKLTDALYAPALRKLRAWIEANDYAGYEPYDLLNSPRLANYWSKKKLIASLAIQSGRHFGGSQLRRWLRVPPSKNPKALALCLSAYCDLQLQGEECRGQAQSLKNQLLELRSPEEEFLCWGYDWDYVSLRGGTLKKFTANCIATYFGASALLDATEVFADEPTRAEARSAGEFLVRRLSRLVDSADHVCFSYTPIDHTLVYNSSALVGALLARLARNKAYNVEYLDLALRSMRYLVDHQNADGSWTYGPGRWHAWIDSFHTGYNLGALLQYQEATGDTAFDGSINRGYEFYKRTFFRADGAPKYYHNRVYPIDIHSCSQAILTFCAFRDRDSEALNLARRIADWTIQNMQSADGTFFYQRHRLWTDRTPYMRWGQAWMFCALSRLLRVLSCNLEQEQRSSTSAAFS